MYKDNPQSLKDEDFNLFALSRTSDEMGTMRL